MYERQGRFDAALRDYQAALAVWERAYGPHNTRIVWALTCIGRVLAKSGDLAGAEPHYARALAVVEAGLGPDHLEVARALVELGIVVRKLGRGHDARRLLERALGIFAAEVGERPPLALATIELGEAALADGDLRRAVTLLERTRRVQGPTTNHPDELARADFALARALRAGEREPLRARELAELAVQRYRAAGEPYAEDRFAVERWLAEQSW